MKVLIVLACAAFVAGKSFDPEAPLRKNRSYAMLIKKAEIRCVIENPK